jgi:hypothetical protein
MTASGATLDRIAREHRLAAGLHLVAAALQAYQFTLQLTEIATHTSYARGFGFRAMLALLFPVWPYVSSWAVVRRRASTGNFASFVYLLVFAVIVAGFLITSAARFADGIGLLEYFVRTVVLTVLLITAAALCWWQPA